MHSPTCFKCHFHHFITLLLIAISILFCNSQGIAIEFQTNISIGIGLEQLTYEEHESDNNMDSKATVNNFIGACEGLIESPYLFFGANAVVPLIAKVEEEDINLTGTSYQVNDIKDEWTRMDLFLGYPVYALFKPYVGIRWSERRQERSNFIIEGERESFNNVETIRSWNILLGIQGEKIKENQWGFSYNLKYLIPFNNTVENDAIQGWDIDDKRGYGFDIQGTIRYYLNNALHVGLVLYGGKIYWEGSDWIGIPGGEAKWPQNETRYMGGMFEIGYVF